MRIFKKTPQAPKLPGATSAPDTGSIGEDSNAEGEPRSLKHANNGESGVPKARGGSSSTADRTSFRRIPHLEPLKRPVDSEIRRQEADFDRIPLVERLSESQRRFATPAHLDELEADVPKFHSAMAEKTAQATDISKVKLWEAFTPARPKQMGRFFAGRRDAIQRMITAIQEDHAHVIIYGPRGIGKTSLANILTESASHAEYRVLRYPCSTGTKFTEIFRSFLKNLPSDYMDRQTQAKYSGIDNFEQLLPSGHFGPTELSEALGHLKLEHAILIVDEFDRVASRKMKRNLVEAMKNLSDNSARVTLIIIGVARSLEELLGIHPSIQRHLVGIHLPLMVASELRNMILAAEKACNLRFDDVTRDMIISFSKGLPYYAQLLALHAGRHALSRSKSVVEMSDFRDALDKVLKDVDPLVKTTYELATRGESNSFVADVLYAAALARFDAYGSFAAADAASVVLDDSGRRIREITLHKALSDLCQDKNGSVIEKWRTPASKTRYVFVLQTMRQFVLLRQAAQRGLM